MDKSGAEEDIAVIGMGCRFPGADNIDEFWRVLINGENHITDIPKERWNNDAFYSEDKDKPGKSYVRKAGFVNGYEEWDNKLFYISKSEAEKIDPQQRQVLTCTHMALEDAGITRKQLEGSQTSVFIGVMNDDYKSLSSFDHNDDTSYSATGMSTTIIAARVSYVYDLRGPCMSVDTACSSSLAAIHLGCQSIRSGECEMAICGGVSCMLIPDQFITLCKARMLSPSGQCQSFCDTADGYGRGEGCGIVILKSYKKALADKSKIWGIVKTGGNQDGRVAKPITAPSSQQQEQLLKRVYSNYGIDPSSLQYIEAHGTGTPVGDPTEINTIGRFIQSCISNNPKGQQKETHDSHVFESKFQRFQHESNIQIENNFIAHETIKAAILIGSVKSNIGHLESAAGVAALIKVLLMMNNKMFVPSLHVKKDKSNVNKEIILEPSGLDICTEVAEWKPDTHGKRVCCVNCFGFGGSNMHAVVIQYDYALVEQSIFNAEDQYKVVCTSALNKAELKCQMDGLSNDLATGKCETHDISFTSVFHRDHFPYKTFVFGKTTEDIQKQLIQKLSDIDGIQEEKEKHTRIIFVFCGVGMTWKGMCREMMQQPVFRETVHEIDLSLKPLTTWSIAEKFLDDTDYNDPFLSHVALFCMQVALFEQWRRWGVHPKAIVGQSVGEVAASYASGALGLKDAIQVIHKRSEILSTYKGGKMMTVQNISVSTLEKLCQKYENRANIAVYNSPVSCTISGDSDALDQITIDLEQMENLNILTRNLSVQCAYHSHHMEKAAKIIEGEINIQNASIRTTDQFSTVTGKLASENEFQTGKYWADNIRKPVLFKDAVTQSLDKNAFNVFIEIGPKQVLRAHLPNIISNTVEGICLPSMNANKECESMYTTLNTLFELGADLAWKHIVCFDGKIVPVPRYIFQKNNNLHIPREKKSLLKGIQQVIGAHMYTSQSDDCGTHFTIHLDKDRTPFVYDHYMFKEVLTPGSTYVEAAFEIGRQISALTVFEISISVEFINTFMPRLNEQSFIDVEVDKDLDNYHLCFKADKKVLCKGNISLRTEVEKHQINIQTIKERCETYRTKTETYSCLEKLNFNYGESLTIIQHSWSSSVECIVEFALPESVLRQRTITNMHPSVIDGMFQTFGILSNAGNDSPTLPKGLVSMVINQYPEKVMYGYSYLERSSATENYFNFLLLSQGGIVLAEIRNFYTKSMTDASDMLNNTVYKLVWPEMPSPDEPFEEKLGKCRHLQIIGPKRFTSWFENIQDQSNELVHAENGDLSKEYFHHIDSFWSVVYAPSSHIQKMAENGRLLSNCVDSFQNLKLVIIAISELNKDIPVFIVTENVMGHQLGSEPNVCGAELWGMARSSINEGVYNNLTLVDMKYSKDNFIALKKLLDRINTNNYNEIMIKDGKYHYLKVIESNIHDIPFRREINNEISEDIVMKSTSATSYTDTFFDARTSKFEVENKEPQCKIHLKRVCLHSSSVFPISINIDGSNEGMYSIEGNTGYTTICVEGTGCRYEAKIDGSNRTTDIGFCCPVYISPVVSIPEKCVFELTSLPIYVPGMLTVGVILWNVVETCSISSTQNILVIVDDASNIWIQLMRTILFDQSLSARIVSKHKLFEMQQNGDIDTVVILAKLEFRHFGLIEKQCPVVKHIVSIEEYFSKPQKVYMKMKSEMVSLNILKVEDMFTYSVLSQKVPNIYKCLVALQNLSFHLYERDLPLEDNKVFTKNILDLPYSELQLFTESEKDTIPLKVKKENVLRQNGCYILVGGLTGLGWELLQLMATKLGAKYIVTFSRHPPTDQRIKEMNTIKETYGCNILNRECDITDHCQVTAAFKYIRSCLGLHVDIRGIFHGAGILRDTFLRDMSDEDLKAVLLPKVLGTWNLHEASMDLQLDFFIMHSSIVSVFGNLKQCNYAAGNSFQDSFAHYRRSLGLCGQSINWGPLHVGMAKRETELEKQLMNQGFHFLTKEEIYDCIIFAMMTNEVQLMFGKFDWVQLQKQNVLPVNSNKFVEMQKTNPIPETKQEESDAIRYHLLTQNPTKQRQIIHDLVRDRISEISLVEKSDLKENTNIMKLSLDSMSAMSFRNDIYQMTKVRIPLATLYDGSTTLDNLTSFLLKKMSLEPELKHPSETICKYLDGNITFMQNSLLNDFDKDHFSRNILRQIDFEILGLQLEKDDLNIVFKHLIAVNPDLRRTFEKTGDTYYSVVHESQINFNIENAEFNSICEDNSIDQRGEVKMDITKDIPIRVMAAIREKRIRVRMFIHAIIGDLSALTYLFHDLGNILKCHLQRKELPFKETTVNFTEALRESILPQIDRLRRFWSSSLNEACSPFTFSANISTELEEEYWESVSVRVPTYIYHKMMKFINSQGITLYNFLISVYFVLLHKYTGKYLIPLVTWADMRVHVPQLKHTIQSCSNAIPVVGDLRETGLVTTYLKKSSNKLYEITQHSAYPYELIKEEMKSDELKMHIGRHRFIMENMTDLNNDFKHKDVELKIMKPYYKRHSYETSLHIEYDTKQQFVDLLFGFNRKALAETYAEQMLHQMLELIDNMVQAPFEKVQALIGGNVGEL